jgi:hypothetical protein
VDGEGKRAFVAASMQWAPTNNDSQSLLPEPKPESSMQVPRTTDTAAWLLPGALLAYRGSCQRWLLHQALPGIACSVADGYALLHSSFVAVVAASSKVQPFRELYRTTQPERSQQQLFLSILPQPFSTVWPRSSDARVPSFGPACRLGTAPADVTP